MRFLVVNVETGGADHDTVQQNLNNLGSKGWEHYDQERILAYLRETQTAWEYRCVTIYGNSTTQTDAINALTCDGWEHYKQIGSRGYFKRIVVKNAAMDAQVSTAKATGARRQK